MLASTRKTLDAPLKEIVETLPSQKTLTVASTTTIQEAVAACHKSGLRCCVVVENQIPLGFVDIRDVLFLTISTCAAAQKHQSSDLIDLSAVSLSQIHDSVANKPVKEAINASGASLFHPVTLKTTAREVLSLFEKHITRIPIIEDNKLLRVFSVLDMFLYFRSLPDIEEEITAHTVL
eukprot:Filipodium_phascolosomae@DN1979_c0_g1_i1.p1